MKPKPDWFEKRMSLRKEAEVIVAPLSPDEALTQPVDRLFHELLVHKIELEMQVEELRQAYDEMEETRDRYVEFYDFAPVGFVSLDRECLIDAINLTAAALLGADRGKLAKRSFSTFVAPQDQDIWHRLFVNMMARAETEKQALVLQLARADGTTFQAYLDCQRRQAVDDGPPMLHLALFDIAEIKQAARIEGIEA